MSLPPALNFVTSVRDRRSAETLLNGKPPGAFISWRISDTTYFVTHVSAIDGAPAHVRLSREPGEGTYSLTDGLDTQERFRTLEDFVASRKYLVPGALGPLAEGEEGEAAAAGGAASGDEEAPASPAPATSLLRKRAGKGGSDGDGPPAARLPASFAAAPPPLGVVPPDDDAAEMYDRAGVAIDEDKYYRGVRPSCSERPLRLWLGALGWLGVALAAACLCARYALHTAARLAFVRISEATEGKVLEHAGALFAVLRGLKGAGGGAAGGGVGATCLSAVQAWQAGVRAAGSDAAVALAAQPLVLPYAWLLLCTALGCGAASLFMFLLHTGRPAIILNTVSKEMRTEPLCRPNQSKWALAFGALLGATLLSSLCLLSLFSGGAGAPSAAGHVAATLSLRWPAAPYHAAPSVELGGAAPPPPPHRFGGASEGEAAAWRYGTWGGAMTYAGAPRECLEAVATIVEPWVDGPEALPMPLPSPAWFMAIFGGGGGGGGGGAVGWFKRTPLHGWLQQVPSLQGAQLQLLLPTRSVLAQASLVLTSVYTFAMVFALMGMESWATVCRPSLLRAGRKWGWWGGGAAKARGAKGT